MRSTRRTLDAAALAVGLLAAAAAGAAEPRHPELAPPGACAEPWVGSRPALAPRVPGADPALAPRVPGAGPAAAAVAAAPPAGAAPAGRIVSLSGSAAAQAPGSASRTLACGDPVYPGDRVVTGSGASAGLLLGPSLTQLGGDTAAELRAGAVELTQGELRVIDPGGSSEPTRVTVLGAETSVESNDVQLSVSGSGASASVCAFEAPLRVTRGSESMQAGVGGCAVVRPGAPLAAGPAVGSRIPALGAPCVSGPPIEVVAHLVPLPPVALGLLRDAPPLPEKPRQTIRSPCDVPGSGCAGRASVEELPSTSGGFPGDGSFGND